jgi:hypothetical protein
VPGQEQQQEGLELAYRGEGVMLHSVCGNMCQIACMIGVCLVLTPIIPTISHIFH